MGDDDIDPFHEYFHAMTKRIEKVINGRMTSMGEQMATIARENDALKSRVHALELYSELQTQHGMYLLRNLDLLIQELDHFEQYLAQKDPVLSAMLEKGKALQAEQIKKRNLLNEQRPA